MSGEIEGFDQERIDRLIWSSAGVKSARETAAETGLDPAKVLQRRKELLDGVDDLTIKQAKQKLLSDLQSISARTQADYDAADFEFKAGLMNSSIAAIKAVLVELNRADKADTERVERLNALRVRELLTLIDQTVYRTFQEIAETHGLEEAELQEIFQRHLRPAAEALEG